MAVYFDQFFDILHADAGEVYPDVRNCGLDVRQITGKCLVRSLIWGQFFNKSSHPGNYIRLLL